MVDSPFTLSELKALLTSPKVEQQKVLKDINEFLRVLTPEQRVAWSLEFLPGHHVLSSSFGIQAAVMLHLLSEQRANIPVILTDTGYLFPETYHFIDEMTKRLNLNLKVYRAPMTPAWQEARFGALWEQGVDGLDRYNEINKVKPMQQAMGDLEVGTWFAGLRRSQSSTREQLPILAINGSRYKMLPIIEWGNKEVHQYLTRYDLPYHPLWEQGYVSIGDVHSSKPLELGMTEEETRFNGMKRECGLHFDI